MIFLDRNQKMDAKVETFLRDLHFMVNTCEYTDPEDQVRDCFVVELSNTGVYRSCNTNYWKGN